MSFYYNLILSWLFPNNLTQASINLFIEWAKIRSTSKLLRSSSKFSRKTLQTGYSGDCSVRGRYSKILFYKCCRLIWWFTSVHDPSAPLLSPSNAVALAYIMPLFVNSKKIQGLLEWEYYILQFLDTVRFSSNSVFDSFVVCSASSGKCKCRVKVKITEPISGQSFLSITSITSES